MRSPIRFALAALAAAAFMAGCGKGQAVLGVQGETVTVPLGDPTGGPGGPTASLDVASCTVCHGTPGFSNAGADPLVAAAPPVEPAGASTSVVGVHRAHLVDGAFSRAVECASCHLVPQTAGPHHPASVVFFSRRATTIWGGGQLPQPTYAAGTCSGVYCHGTFKNGANATPSWTAAGSVACGSCHLVGVDGPGGTHPKNVGTDCGACHGQGYTSTTVNLATHMNGVLDIPTVTCSGCHGDSLRAPVATATAVDVDGNPLVKAAPPTDTDGLFVSTAVGAHLAHVSQGDTAAPGALSSALACVNCHVVPTSKTHATGTVDITFGGIATTDGATPSYDRATASCAASYCHGGFPGGNGANPVSWTGTGKLGCTDCHAAPPPANATSHHPPNPTCGTCHPGYSASIPTAVVQATHVNGTPDHTPATGCTQCHGDVTASGVANTDSRAAPGFNPNAIDAHGNPFTATNQPGIGVHQAHLTGTDFRSTPISCGDCHVVPAVDDFVHANGSAEVPFGGLALSSWGGVTQSPQYAGGTCSGVYCHGHFKNGNNVTMTWAALTPVAVPCGSCHGLPPGGGHPTSTNCGSCHTGYTQTTVNPANHLNGKLDF